MVGMKSTKAAKDHRRARRTVKSGRRDAWSLTPIGGTMDPELLRSIRAATRDLDPTAPWPTHASKLVPMIKRVWQPFTPGFAPLAIDVPPGIPVGFGLDIGPAMHVLDAGFPERWGVDHATLLSTSLANLQRLVREEPPIIQRFRDELAGDIVSIGGQGWGSALLLLPDVLHEILGDEPRVLLAPVRNHLIALTMDVTLDTCSTIWAALADGAHDELDVPLYFWEDRQVLRYIGAPDGEIVHIH
jgi:hypothetical protein